MDKILMNKPLSPSQKKHLVELQTFVQIAIANRDNFINYLRNEHDAPVALWKLENIETGFEPVPQNGVAHEVTGS